jgi:hypothetical protein
MLITAIALAVTGIAGAASAKQFGFCSVKTDSGIYYLSAIVELGDGSNGFSQFQYGPFGNGFWQHIKATADINAGTPDCHSEKRLSDAQEFFARMIRVNQQNVYRQTGWSGGLGAPTEAASKPAPSGAYLTVESNTGLRDAGKAWDAQVKKTLQAEAQKKVETAAKAAAADAQRQAEIEAFFRERRKQGAAQ